MKTQRWRAGWTSAAWLRLCLVGWLVLLAGCTARATHPSLVDADLPPLLQAHRFAYTGQVVRAYHLSPDGRKLAWIGPHLMRSRLFVRDNESGEIRRFRIGSSGFQWTPDGKRVLYLADTSGAENFHVYMIDVESGSGEAVDLTPYPGVKAYIHQLVHGTPNQLMVLHNRRDRRVFDLYRINLDTREETLISTNPGDAVAAVTTSDGRLMRWQTSRYARRTPEHRRKPLAARESALKAEQGETFRVLGKDAKDGLLWALSSRGRDRVALVGVHPTLGWEKVVAEDPHVDVTRVTMSRVTGNPLVVHSDPGYPRDEILDPDLEKDLAPLLKHQRAERFGFEIVSTDATENRMIVLIHTSAQQTYYLVDRVSGSYTVLAESLPEDMAAALGDMNAVTIPSRDGLSLHGYLTLPRGAASKALPMVLLVHGGPWLRNTWGSPLRSDDAAYAHFLANRGYAVLQVNFRGSMGYGRSFLMAGIGEFGASMQDDLHDAMRWAVQEGIADPQRVAIVGWSYGGYAALLGLSTSPQVFACGVSWNGPTDLASMIESFPPYWSTDLSMWYDYVGDPAIAEDREEMDAKSPLYHAQKIEKPVLIVQGANDVRVRPDHADRMVQALRSSGKSVQYLVVPKMGHGMGYWVHRLAVLRKTETFLRECIGGRASRFDPFDAVAWVWTRVKG
jgi:dipeptidyl aminopeptidase/acylaminoacyl peptidase